MTTSVAQRRRGEEPVEWSAESGWPSPQEIAERAAEIRAGWKVAERRRRCCYPDREVETPSVAVADVAAAL